jgi:hypothetical protein
MYFLVLSSMYFWVLLCIFGCCYVFFGTFMYFWCSYVFLVLLCIISYSGHRIMGSQIIGSIGKWDQIYLWWLVPNYPFIPNLRWSRFAYQFPNLLFGTIMYKSWVHLYFVFLIYCLVLWCIKVGYICILYF